MRKIAQVAFAIIKSGKPFNPHLHPAWHGAQYLHPHRRFPNPFA